MDKTTVGIVVNYDYYARSKSVQSYVHRMEGRASLVLFVTDHETDPGADDVAWDVVIGNHGKLPPSAFKVAALAALSNHSNVYPAVVVDDKNYDVYDDAGALVILGETWFG